MFLQIGINALGPWYFANIRGGRFAVAHTFICSVDNMSLFALHCRFFFFNLHKNGWLVGVVGVMLFDLPAIPMQITATKNNEKRVAYINI